MPDLCSLVNTEVRSKLSEINILTNSYFSRKISQEIFTLCKNGDEDGIRRMIAAGRAVAHVRDTGLVSCPKADIACRIYMFIYCIPPCGSSSHLTSLLYKAQ